MAESKFLPFQDTDGDLHNDKCKIDDIVVEVKECVKCTPNEAALVPDWRKQTDPFLNEKNCKYQITYKTNETTTGYDCVMSESEADAALDGIFEMYVEDAIVALLEFYNKETTVGAIALIKENIEYTDYDLEARPNSRLKLLYSVHHQVLDAVGDAEEDEETEEDNGDLTVTYNTSELQEKLLRVRKGLKLYNRYYNIFSVTADAIQKFVFDEGAYKGKEFVLKNYGDFGLGINNNNKAKLELVYEDLAKFLRDAGLELRQERLFSFKEPITKIEMSFDRKYKITKLKVFTEKCGIKPTVFTGKLKHLRKLSGWKDKTAVAYFAQLDKMDQDLQARTPKPWAEFIKEYTYPRVILTGETQGLAGEQTAPGCVAQAIGNKVFDGSFFDEEFSFSDALALKWYDTYCNSDQEEVQSIKEQLGVLIDRSQVARAARALGQDPQTKLSELYNTAKEQAYGKLKVENDPFSLICVGGAGDLSFTGNILVDLKLCGLEAALTQAITCLFGGLTLEQALSSVVKSALSAMDITRLNELFIGLPPEQQAELNELAQKKLKEGDLFKADSTNQEISDAIAGNDIPTLSEYVGGRTLDATEVDEDLKDRVDGWFESGFVTNESDPNSKKRTLAQKFDNPSGNIKEQQLLAAYVAALLDYYADNLLELVDQLNRFPGARLISNALLAVDCPRPALFNPGVFEFIRDLELPFCRNIEDITLPKLVNPFKWVPEISDILGALFTALRAQIEELVISILLKLFLKICDIIGSAVCKALETAGSLAAGLVTGGGTEELRAIFRNAVCGDDASDEDINNAIAEMFANFGAGAQAFANQERTVSLAESMANTMSRKEMADAFLGNMSPDASTIMIDVIEAEYPEFSDALSTQEQIGQMFSSMGQLLPAEFRNTLADVAAGIPENEVMPVNPSLCATPEQLEEFCAARSSILECRASPEQIKMLCNTQVNTDDLSDLQSALNGNYIENNMPPITSDPGCDNGLLPYEPEVTVQAITSGLGNDLEMLQVDYSTDMIGNGPLERNWGMLNMMMSDTNGLPLTTHIRNSSINPFYADQYGTFFPDPTVIAAAGLVSPPTALILNTLDNSNKNGVYPEKMAAYLQYYMNGEIDGDITSVGYNNVIQPEIITTEEKQYSYFQEKLNNIPEPYVSDTSYNTESEYIYDEDGNVTAIQTTYGVRKMNSDIKLTFDDYAYGYRQLEQSEYSYGFDIEAYTAELDKDEEQVSNIFNIFSDNMRIKITDRNNLAAKKFRNDEEEEISLNENFDPRGILDNQTRRSQNPDEILSTSGSSALFDGFDVEETIKYQFLAVDDTFAELGDELEEYTDFYAKFNSYGQYQPQTYLLREIIQKTIGVEIGHSNLETYRSVTSKTIMDEMFRVVADSESEINAWTYGAEVETLGEQDTEYGINDNGTWIPYKDTGYENEQMILGISYDQYKNEVSGTLDKTRVFYLDPAEFGGTYKKPGIYIKPPEFKGWFGLIDVLFPEYSPCKPHSTNLVDFDQIKEIIDEIYPNIPEDERLKSDPDCIVELPYNRVLERPAKAGMMGLIIAACRIYASAHIVKSLPTFSQFSPNFPEVYSTAYASYIIEDMKESFKSSKGRETRNFTDDDFWYAFLEQCVQMYAYRIDIGDVEPSETVLQALSRLNDLQDEYEYPTSRADAKGDIGVFQTLKNYRLEKNLEAVKRTEEDAKIIMKEWVVEQLNYMSSKLIKNLEEIGFEPEIKDLGYYVMERFCSGTSLSINQNIDSDGNVKAVYGDLPTIPFEDNDEVSDPYYTFGGELVVSEVTETRGETLTVGQEYVGYYHVYINETGDVIYMVGEYHSDRAHAVLKPIATIMTVPIGDVNDINTVSIDPERPYILEKYISIDGVRYSTSAAMDIVRAQDQNLLVSEVYPGTMELITNDDGVPTGITGEFGLRYGLKFSIVIDGTPYELTSVEIDALDLPLNNFTTLSANSVKLYCLLKELKEDSKFKMLTKYIIPMGKFTALTAMYNDMAMLPSIGQIIAQKQNILDATIEGKLKSLPGPLPEFINTVTEVTATEDLDLEGKIVGDWAHPDDRTNRIGILVQSWDTWDRDLLFNSTGRIKKLFKTYYNSRDFDPTDINENTDGPGKIFEKNLKNIFRPAPGRQILPWFKKRDLKDNPFNSLGEICKKDD